MTLPKMPLKEWLSSSSSPQQCESKGWCVASCFPRRSLPGIALLNRLLAPIRKVVKDGSKKLRFSSQNALQNLIKTLFESSCGLACGRHTGRDGPEIRPFMRPHSHPHEVPDLVFSSYFRATVLAAVPLQFPGLENAVFGANFILHYVVELPRLLQCL